jgi:hypothetical protein
LNLSVFTNSTFIPSSAEQPSVVGGFPRANSPGKVPPASIGALSAPPTGILQPLQSTLENQLMPNREYSHTADSFHSMKSLKCDQSYLGGRYDSDNKSFYNPADDEVRSVVSNQSSSYQDHDYRAERLQKQRQDVEGGSLFVTSPRSFLMGFKKSFHDSSVPVTSIVY